MKAMLFICAASASSLAAASVHTVANATIHSAVIASSAMVDAPEPGTLLLFGLPLVLISLIRRKQNKQPD